MTDWREELIEKMAKAAWEGPGNFFEWKRLDKITQETYLEEAHAALAVAEPVIREWCAEIAENYGYDVSASKYASSVGAMCAYGAAKDIAAAIREGGREGVKTKPSSVEEIRKQTKNLIDAHKKSIQDFHENHFPHLFGREGRMIDWAPEAIEAAHRAMFQEPYDGTTAAMIGAGLDAAAAAQGIKDEEITRLREELAAVTERMSKLDFERTAAELERDALREENARLREALKPFAEAFESDYAEQEEDHWDLWESAAASILTYGHLRAARAAIREGGKDE